MSLASALSLNSNLTSSVPPVDALCRAIRERRLVRFEYAGRPRVVEPYLCGRDRHGHDLLTAWQAEGASSSGPPIGWRTYRVDQISGLVVLSQTFTDVRGGFVATDERMPVVHCRVPETDA